MCDINQSILTKLLPDKLEATDINLIFKKQDPIKDKTANRITSLS